MKQKAIITITDKDQGKIDVNISFDPPIKPNDPTTPAVEAAMTMVELFAQSLKTEKPS